MTSRQRVLTALRHEQPDRVPVDMGAMGSTSIMALAYNQLRKHLGRCDGVLRVCNVCEQLAEPEKWVLDKFGVDVIGLDRSLPPVDDPALAREFVERFGGNWRPWTLPDGTPCETPEYTTPRLNDKGEWIVTDDQGHILLCMPQGACYFTERFYIPLKDATTVEEINAHPLHVFTDEHLEFLRAKAKWLYENTDYAIMGAFGGNILEYGQMFRGWSEFMMDLVAAPKIAEALMDRLMENHLTNLDLYLDAVGDYIQVITMGDDLGTQTGLQMSPELYEKTIHPRHKRIYQLSKTKRPDVHVFIHCCGSIYDLIPYLIDEGIDILNPVQTSAANMDPRRLKKEFGNRLSFWGGGVDTQHNLPFGSPEEVYRQVRERIDIFNVSGGFVFNTIHNIQAGTPPENILAMFQAVRDSANE